MTEVRQSAARNQLEHETLAPRALGVEEFCRLYRIGRTSAYEEMASGRLRSYTLGRRRFISTAAAEQWQRALEAQAEGA